MKTISITIPEELESLEEGEVRDVFQQFFGEFLREYFDDVKLKNQIRNHSRIHALTDKLAEVV